MKKVLVFGTFDGLHEGHFDLFRQARQYGDYLIVVVGRDSSVNKQKNKKSKNSEQERLKKVQECELVNEARLGNENHDPRHDRYSLIEEIKPDVICLGYDQAQYVERLKEELKKMNLEAEIKVLKPYKQEIYKSSIINSKIKSQNAK